MFEHQQNNETFLDQNFDFNGGNLEMGQFHVNVHHCFILMIPSEHFALSINKSRLFVLLLRAVPPAEVLRTREVFLLDWE